MRVRLASRALGLLLVLVVAATGTAFAEGEAPVDQRFFLRNDGADCGAASHPFLSETAGSGEGGCGYIGGLPFGEIFHTAEVDTAASYVTEDPIELTVDAARDINGRITVSPYFTVTGATGTGVGQVLADVTASGWTADGTAVELGSARVEAMANPVASRQELQFAILIPDELDGIVLEEFTLKVNVRGAHLQHGFTELDGASHVNVPLKPPVVAEPTPSPTPAPAP